MSEVDPVELCELGARVAVDAGQLLEEGLARTRVVVGTKTSRTDLVTEYDRRSEELIVDGLLDARPDDGILGEEGGERPGTSGVRWIVDPLDGTTNYFYGYPAFAVAIAAEHEGSIVAGIVYDVARHECFTATRGGGAYLDGAPIAVGDADELATALIGTGFSYDPERRRRQAEVVTHVLPAVRDLRRAGAAAIDLCHVAAGRLDGFYERGLQRWDLAAGALVASEAGAAVGDLDGGPPSWEFALAATPPLFPALRDLLVRAGAADA